jgi:hypothetical protein
MDSDDGRAVSLRLQAGLCNAVRVCCSSCARPGRGNRDVTNLAVLQRGHGEAKRTSRLTQSRWPLKQTELEDAVTGSYTGMMASGSYSRPVRTKSRPVRTKSTVTRTEYSDLLLVSLTLTKVTRL